MLEELGHHLDTHLHALDAPGDEGELFAALALGRSLTAAEWQALRQQDDSGAIGGVAVEFSETPFAIAAAGTLTINNGGDFDGDPLDASDDALIYAADGFTINVPATLPVQRDEAGDPVLQDGQPLLVDRAVAVAAGYSVLNAPDNPYAGLVPPQVVEEQVVAVPSFTTVRDDELSARIPAGTPSVSFDASQQPLNSAADWETHFPAGGTAEAPTVVDVTGGGLTVPDGVRIANTAIRVASGDLNFNGSSHQLENVVLVTDSGSVNLAGVRARDLSVLVARSLQANSSARFAGTTLLANDDANGLTFNGATATTDPEDTLTAIARGRITYNAAADTRGDFLSADDFTFNNNSTLIGTIRTQQDVIFNGQATVIGVSADGDELRLVEEDNFQVEAREAIAIPEAPSLLSFAFAERFDTADPDFINDAFEVALVEGDGTSLVHAIAPGRDAFFNLTEGASADLATGVTVADGLVTVDLADIPGGTDATLIFRLVNNDGDTTTEVTIRDIAVTSGGSGNLSSTPEPDPASAAEPVDFAALEDVSASFRAEYGQTSFDDARDRLFVELAARNQGGYEVRDTLLVAVANLSAPSVQVLDADGFTPDGLPYLDLSRAIADGTLRPDAATAERVASFFNPERVPFDYDLVFLSQLNRAPAFVSDPNLEVVAGTPYAYDAEAIDPDGDALTYALTGGPDGLTVDATTGEIAWAPTAADVGTAAVTVQVEDGRGGTDTQTYTLTVTAGVANSDPSITSAPPTEALPGATFTYPVAATDPDGDFLTYYLDDAPAGMAIARETGLVSWTPAGERAGEQPVTVRVIDGRGRAATQTFALTVAPELENLAPTFDSIPVPNVERGETYRYRATATDPDGDTLSYDLSLAPEGMVVDSATDEIFWKPDAEQDGTTTVIVRARDGRGGIDLQVFELAVTLPNVAPTIASQPPAPAYANLPYEYRVAAQDADGAIASYQLASAPAGMSIDAATGAIAWTPETAQVGATTVVVTATDDRGASATQSFVLDVLAEAPTNAPPAITSEPSPLVQLGRTYRYALRARDPDGDPLTYSVATGPNGLAIAADGKVTWTPTEAQFGSNQVALQVDDGRGGVLEQRFSIQVVAQDASNRAPEITSAPDSFSATAGTQYAYDATAIDPDGDLVLWSLETAPAGMSLDPERGTLRWTPALDQVGPAAVEVRAVDARGAASAQTFTLTVRGANLPPTIASAPLTLAAVDSNYRYVPVARDPNRDPLRFRLATAPTGMTIDATTGAIAWTPTADQLGNAAVTVEVSDAFGSSASQTYSIEVRATASNQAPAITSQPVFRAAVGELYQYPVTAADPDGDALTFELLSGPAGTSIDPQTGLLSWTPTSADVGTYAVAVGAVDPAGLGGAQRFSLTVTVNAPPAIASDPTITAAAGQTYRYDLRASDPDGDPLTYDLAIAPDGMSIDALGRVRWEPTAADVGVVPVEIVVRDGSSSVVQAYDLTVTVDSVAPEVRLVPSVRPVALGESVTLFVSAADNVGVADLSLSVDGTPVPLDARGLYTFTPAAVGELVAIATDAAGNASQAQTSVSVLDFSDAEAPEIALSLPDNPVFTAPTEIRGTVSDPTLVDYTLAAAPVGSSNFRELARETSPVSDGVLATFDPTLLQNGSYTLRLSARDAGGNVVAIDETISVEGDLKLGNFQVSFVDLELPVAGIPVTLTRTYDTLTAGEFDDFGFGWRLEFRDTNLRTSLGEDEVLPITGVPSRGFQRGDKVYLTLPGGERERFTFDPKLTQLGGFLLSPSGGGGLYEPRFVPEADSDSTLTVPDVTLTQAPDGQFLGLAGVLYNPAASYFGSTYTLTTREGIVYDIDAQSGDLLTATNPNENTLIFSDSGIRSDSGREIAFARDARGRIAIATDPLGQAIRYEYNANGDLVSVTDRTGAETTFEYLDSEERAHYLERVIDPLGRTGARSEYGPDGRLTRMLDVDGEAIAFSYDLENSLQTIRDALGNETVYEYDSRGNIVATVDALGGITRRTFDTNDNPLSYTDPLGNTTRHAYDSEGNLVEVTDALGNSIRFTFNQFGEVLTETDPLGNTTTYTYDSRGNRLSVTTPREDTTSSYAVDAVGNVTAITEGNGATVNFAYDRFGNVTRQIDALGHETAYAYDAAGRKTGETTQVTTAEGTQDVVQSWTYDDGGRVTSFASALGQVTRQEYDELGNLTAAIDPLGRRTEYRYDEDRRRTEVLYPDGTSERFVYDALGREIETVDRSGRSTHFVYDALDRIVETIYPDGTPATLEDNPREVREYDAAGRVTATVDERGFRTEHEYDARGQRILRRDALGNEARYRYDRAGQLVEVIDALGRETETVYDELGREIETLYPDGTRTATVYDAAGRRSAAIDEAGRATRYRYDAENRIVEIVLPDATPEDLTDNSRRRREYDELGRLVAEIDERGFRTETDYDLLGRPRATHVAGTNFQETYTYDAVGNRTSLTDALGNTTQFIYDEVDRLTTAVYADGTESSTVYDAGRAIAETDSAGRTTQFEYDARDRLTAVVDALGQRTEYEYDATGNLTAIADATGRVTWHEYDALGRRVVTELPLGQRALSAYDAVGNRTSYTDFNGNTLVYEYDGRDRLSAKRYPDSTAVEYGYTPAGLTASVADARGTTTCTYDARDRLIERVDPDGRAIGYEYDAANNRTAVALASDTTTYEFDGRNRLTAVTSPDGSTTRYSYNGADNLIATEFPNNVVETRGYDALNRLVNIDQVRRDPLSGEAVATIASYDYTLDAVGNRLAVNELTRRVEYDYDDLDRLTRESIFAGGTQRTFDYAYDAIGNRLSRDDSETGLTAYEYDANERLVREARPDGDVTYEYDANGNVLSRANNNGRTDYEWDFENRLVGIDENVQYFYNEAGVRVAAIVDGIETRYLLDENRPYAQVLEEYAPAGNLKVAYIYGNDLIAQTRAAQVSYYQVDGLGSTRTLTDEAGNVTDTYIYDAYGVLLSAAGQTVNSYRYAGEQFDEAAQQYYLRARYYDPSNGRFTARDPFEGIVTEPLSLAKYSYVHGNPVNDTDPSGLIAYSLNEGAAVQAIAVILAGIGLSIIGASLQTTAPGFPDVEIDGLPDLGNIGRNPISVAKNLTVPLAKRAAEVAMLTGQRPNMRGFPVIIWAPEYGDIYTHDRDALLGRGDTRDSFSGSGGASNSPGLAPAFLWRRSGEWGRTWLNGKPQFAGASNGRDRDEYPFNSVWQGGPIFYEWNTVSLRYANASLNRSQGSQLGRFYGPSRANVVADDPKLGWFANLALPMVRSVWIDRQGRPHTFRRPPQP